MTTVITGLLPPQIAALIRPNEGLEWAISKPCRCKTKNQKQICAWRWRAHLWKPTTTQGVLVRFAACRSATANFCTEASSSVSGKGNQTLASACGSATLARLPPCSCRSWLNCVIMSFIHSATQTANWSATWNAAGRAWPGFA